MRSYLFILGLVICSLPTQVKANEKDQTNDPGKPLETLSEISRSLCEAYFGHTPTVDDFTKLTVLDLLLSRKLSIEEKGRMLLATEEYLSAIGGWDYGRAASAAPSAHSEIKLQNGVTTSGIEFRSNAYLNMQTSPAVIEAAVAAVRHFGTGSGAARLIGGTTTDITQLERNLATFSGHQSAMVTATGFQANLVVWNIVQRGDIVLEDAASHRSNSDGLEAAKQRLGAKFTWDKFAHNDLSELAEKLALARATIDANTNSKVAGNIYISIEGIYSMDGDRAPLQEIVQLARNYKAKIVIDDAHGFGVTGERGKGTAASMGLADEIYLSVGTLSKSFGSQGGFVAGNAEAIHALRFFSSNYVFTAALAPASVAAAAKSLDLMMTANPSPVAKLQANVDEAVRKLSAEGLPIPKREDIHGGIVPVFLDGFNNTRAIPAYLKQHGILAVVVEFPAVAKNKPRIRLGIMAEHTSEDIDVLVSALVKLVNDPYFAPPRAQN